MRLGIFAKTFAGTEPLAVLQAARDAGFAAVQYNMACSGLASMPDDIPPGVTAAIAQASDATGMAIAAVSGTYNMVHPDKYQRDQGMRRLGLLIANARAMGTGMVTLCTGTRDPQDQWRGHPDNALATTWALLCTQMAKAAAMAETDGITLGIEPELANVVSDAGKARLLIDTLQSPNIAIVLDPANLFEVTTLPQQRRIISHAVDLLADRTVMAHAKDRDARGGFVAAGQGSVDFDHFLAALQMAGFNGDLVAHGLPAQQAAGVARFLTDRLNSL